MYDEIHEAKVLWLMLGLTTALQRLITSMPADDRPHARRIQGLDK